MNTAPGGSATSASTPAPVLRVDNLVVEYTKAGWFRTRAVHRAVQGVSFEIARGETLALVGESGCGKSTLARAIPQLVRATSGRVIFQPGSQPFDVMQVHGEELRQARRQVQMVFQDPSSSLDPRLTAAGLVAEPLRCFGMAKTQALAQARELLLQVGLDADAGNRYAHQFSGGQRQRIGLARAIALQPALVILDEPVSALDVSVQVQILDLLRSLRQRLGLTYLFISHDLAVVRLLADRVAVMQAGRIVETGLVDDIFTRPQHPYTQALLAAVPDIFRPPPWDFL